MRNFYTMSEEEKQNILQQHNGLYNGYNVPSNMTPLTTYDAAKDKEGIVVDMNGNVKTYRNHKINEITAKPLNYDEIDPAYEFESDGPQQSMTQMGMGTKPYDFVSKGPSDVFEDDIDFEDLLDDEDYTENERDQIEENVKKTIDVFKRFKNFN